MRTDKALKNSFMEIGANVVLIVFAFVIKRIINNVLGAEYLGVSGLFSSLISGLCIVELGFGNAIIYNMYRPVADNNIPRIKVILNFYKKVYRIIAMGIFAIGLVILPFVEHFVGETTVDLNLKLIFLLYIIDVVATYLVAYKRSMLYVNQMTYITTFIHMSAMIVTYLLQIVALILTHSFYVYLIISVVFRIVENAVINIIVNKKYPYVLEKTQEKLDAETVGDIKQKVKGLVFHNMSSFLVSGTDNIIISVVPGLCVIMVGIYSAYSLITSKIIQIINSIFNSLTSSVGNLLAEKDNKDDRIYKTFKNIFLINSWIYIFVAASFYYISFPFIEIWMGKSFVLDKLTVFVIALNLFVNGFRAPFTCFKNAAGIFYEDRFVPIIESFVNLVVSIIFALMWGLKGVLLGTIISKMVLYVYTYPKFIYKSILGKNAGKYVKDIAIKLLQFTIVFVFTGIAARSYCPANVIFNLFYKIAVCMIVPNIFMLIMNFKTEEFEFIKSLIIKVIKSFKLRKN